MNQEEQTQEQQDQDDPSRDDEQPRGDDQSRDEAKQKREEEDEQAKQKIEELEENPPEKLEDWPDDKAKYETFGGAEGNEGYDESVTKKLGPSSLRYRDDGSVEIEGEKVDDPDEYKGDPIPGGPTDPEVGGSRAYGEPDLTDETSIDPDDPPEGGDEGDGDSGDSGGESSSEEKS